MLLVKMQRLRLLIQVLQNPLQCTASLSKVEAHLQTMQQAELEKKIKVIQERDVVEADTPHDPLEIEFEKNISIGPPTLTRFEKARILGARALQNPRS